MSDDEYNYHKDMIWMCVIIAVFLIIIVAIVVGVFSCMLIGYLTEWYSPMICNFEGGG